MSIFATKPNWTVETHDDRSVVDLGQQKFNEEELRNLQLQIGAMLNAVKRDDYAGSTTYGFTDSKEIELKSSAAKTAAQSFS